MKILLDLDGVLVNFIGGALREHDIAKNPYDDPRNHGEWDIVKLVGMMPAKFWRPLGHSFWLGLDWMPDGRDILEMLEKAVGPDNIALCTAPCDTDGCMDGKREWVWEHLPRYKSRLLMTQDKSVSASAHACLVDDSDKNVEKFREAGGLTILVPRPWNKWHALSDRAAQIVAWSLEG